MESLIYIIHNEPVSSMKQIHTYTHKCSQKLAASYLIIAQTRAHSLWDNLEIAMDFMRFTSNQRYDTNIPRLNATNAKAN